MNTKRALIITLALATLTTAASADVLLIDFGQTELQSDPARFNNFIPAVQTINNAINDQGDSTGITIDIVNPFFTNGEPSSLGTESPTGEAAQFGVAATDDYFFGHTGPFAGADSNPLSVIEFRNLDANTLYSFTIFTSRSGVNDNREAEYELIGSNNASGLLNASNNDSEVLVLSDLVADQFGTITMNVSAGPNNTNNNGFYYLGAIRIDANPVPASSGLALFGVGSVLATRRRRS
jgi:hypothetical protein